MFIFEAVEKAQVAGRLVVWPHSRQGIERRVLLVTQEMSDTRLARPDLGFAWKNMAGRRGGLMRMCDAFIEGSAPLRRIFKPLANAGGMVEMKITAPGNGIRLIGGFAQPEVFVGLELKLREDIRDWAGLIRDCQLLWERLLPHVPRHLPPELRHY